MKTAKTAKPVKAPKPDDKSKPQHLVIMIGMPSKPPPKGKPAARKGK